MACGAGDSAGIDRQLRTILGQALSVDTVPSRHHGTAWEPFAG